MFGFLTTDGGTVPAGDESASKTSFPREGSEFDWLGAEDDAGAELPQTEENRPYIAVGDCIPYGIRLFYETSDNVVRMMDLGERHRMLILGVIGSFTPYCWNRHLFRVINKSKYYEERGIDFICCISTNDAFCQAAWSTFLGCEDSVFMLSDSTKRFTKEIGMDIVVPWLDSTVRSRRYIIYAEDMVVSKMLVSDSDGPNLKWECEHLKCERSDDEEDDDYELWT